jgi:hypothetical protein
VAVRRVHDRADRAAAVVAGGFRLHGQGTAPTLQNFVTLFTDPAFLDPC